MKMLLIAACLVNYLDDRGGQAHDAGEFVDVTKDTAKTLADNERALYTRRSDDHMKDGRYTATADLIAAAEAAAGAGDKAPQKPAA